MTTERWRAMAALGLAFTGAAACEAQWEVLDRPYPCALNAKEDQCGTSRDGHPMVCYPGSQLGGTDFCAEACDPGSAPDRPGFTCLTSGALLQRCKPHAGAGDPGALCPPGLSCYRTDLFADEGVCLMMSVCKADKDCKDPARSVCATTFIEQTSPSLAGATTLDNLQCMKPTCQTSTSDCATNEACLADYFATGTAISDICVPLCDYQNLCPPNFSCARGPASPGAPRVCLPGLPGQRCRADQDCVVGACQDTGAGFGECVLPFTCASDESCRGFEGIALFLCVEGVPGQGHYCMALTPFQGANCDDDSGCPKGQRCFSYSPVLPDQGHGECRVPCDSSQPCAPRGGIPHACLDDGRGGCYPGKLGLPCTLGRSECVSDLVCAQAGPDGRSRITSPTICTKPCTSDLDCTGDVAIGPSGYCDGSLCRLTGFPGDPCNRNGECITGECMPQAGATEGRCK